MTALWVAATTVLGAILRVQRVGARSLWLDEAQIWWIASGNLRQLLRRNALGNSAPPAFPLLVHMVAGFDASEAALRSISLAAGVASVPALFLLARRFVAPPWAAAAALLVAVAPVQVEYSQELREYSLTFLLATLLLLSFVRCLERPSVGRAAAVGGLAGLAILVQYGLALLVAGLSLIGLVALLRSAAVARAPRGQPTNGPPPRLVGSPLGPAAGWLLANALAGVAAVAVVALGLRSQYSPSGFAGSGYLSASYWDGSVASLGRLLFSNTATLLGFAFPTVVFAAAVGLGLVVAFAGGAKRVAGWLLVVPTGLVLVAALARQFPYTGHRQNMALVPMLFVAAAIGLERLAAGPRGRWVAWAVLAFLVLRGLQGVAALHADPGKENLRPIVARLESSLRPGDRVYIYCGAVPAFRYYTRGRERRWVAGVSSRDRPEAYLTQLDRLLAEGGGGPLWLVFSHVHGGEMDLILAHLRARRQVSLVASESGAWLYRAAAPDDA